MNDVPLNGCSQHSGLELEESLVGQVADEFTERLNCGEQPAVEEYAQRYPQIADLLRQALPALQAMAPAASEPALLDEPTEPQQHLTGCLGDFRILREIGRGGMGIVYEAEQISLRRRVALKVLPFAAAIDSRQLQRFQNEALAAAHLRHENIVPVYAVGSERGVHYYAMQFVEGESLASLIGELRSSRENDEGRITNDERSPNDERRMSRESGAPKETPLGLRHSTLEILSSFGPRHSSFFRTVADLGRQAALALAHAHERGIVHRDIKPANLLLDVHGQVWVADFGLAQCSTITGLTLTGELVGTMRYASPEQALGKRGLVDQRTDIYSLGATLFELLTLRPIFDGRDRHELLRQIADTEPRPPRSLDKAIPEELETIVLKAVAKEPSERYATAGELADDLQRFREDRPIRARRPSPLEKATKWARRHKGAVVSAVMVLLLLAAGMSLTTVLIATAYEQERQQRARAEKSFREAREAVDQWSWQATPSWRRRGGECW